MDINKLPGPLKFAILIHSLGQERANIILEKMSPAERKTLKKHLAELGSISPDIVKKVVEEFVNLVKRAKDNQLTASSPPVLSETSQSEKEEKEEDRDEENKSEKETSDSEAKTPNLESLQSLPPERIVDLIKDEHPQTIAVILAHFRENIAGQVLIKLPDEIRPGVAIRIASLDKVRAELIKEVDRVFEVILKDTKAVKEYEVGGVERLASILNQIDGDAGHVLMDEIEEIDPTLATEINQRRFVFEDLVLVDDRGLQQVLRQVDSKSLAMALKAASEEVREKVFKNMSTRAADMLKEEIESLGAVRMKEVETAQLSVTQIIQDMEAKGEIIISGRGGNEFV